MAKFNKKIITFTIVAAAVIGGGFWFWPEARSSADSNSANSPDKLFTVKRENMVLGVIVSGVVNARKKHKLGLEANTNTKVLWLIPENTHVKEGELIVKFDAEDLKNKISDMAIEIDNLEKELDVMLEQQIIQESTDVETMRNAGDKLEQAMDSQRKYRRYELRASRDSFDSKISDAETALVKARNEYNEYRDELATTSNSDQTEKAKLQANLETKKKAVSAAEQNLESAESNRKVFLRYDNPTKVKNLVNSVDQATLNLRTQEVSVNSTKVQKQRQIDNMRSRIRRQKEDFARQQSYVPMMELQAPVDGIILYGDPDERWRRSEIKTGMDAHRGMVLITIPDMRNLIVDFDMPEIHRSKVAVANDVIITPDSIPTVKINGKVDSIATVPVPEIFWDPESPKVFKSKIEMDDKDKLLVNGMSVQIDIITGTVNDTLCVPNEAVFEKGGTFFVYRKSLTGVDETVVTIGQTNDSQAEITSGLKEGDVIYLYRPFQKK